MTLLFVLAIRELGSSLFLYTSDTTVMAVLLLDYYEGGNIGKTAAFSLVQTVILGGAARHHDLAFARRGAEQRPRRLTERQQSEETTMKRRTVLAGIARRRRRHAAACRPARSRTSSAPRS